MLSLEILFLFFEVQILVQIQLEKALYIIKKSLHTFMWHEMESGCFDKFERVSVSSSIVRSSGFGLNVTDITLEFSNAPLLMLVEMHLFDSYLIKHGIIISVMLLLQPVTLAIFSSSLIEYLISF